MRFPLLLLALLALLWSPAARAATPLWQVTEVSGDVRLQNGDGVRPARRGVSLNPGDAVLTGTGGRAVLTRGQEFVIVAPGARLRLPAVAERPGGIVQMLQDFGSAVYRIQKKMTPHFGVETPYLAAVVKGTTFRVVAGPQGASVEVLEGRVEVATGDGGERRMAVPGVMIGVSAAQPGQLTVGGKTSTDARAKTTISSISASNEIDDTLGSSTPAQKAALFQLPTAVRNAAEPTPQPAPAPDIPRPTPPTPAMPAPVTPAPVTPAPVTPVPTAPTPTTPTPATPAPVTPAPPPPVTPAPVNPTPPATPAPVQPLPPPPTPVPPAGPDGSPDRDNDGDDDDDDDDDAPSRDTPDRNHDGRDDDNENDDDPNKAPKRKKQMGDVTLVTASQALSVNAASPPTGVDGGMAPAPAPLPPVMAGSEMVPTPPEMPTTPPPPPEIEVVMFAPHGLSATAPPPAPLPPPPPVSVDFSRFGAESLLPLR